MEPINPSVAISRAFSATHTQIQAALNNLANQQAYVEETLLQHEQQVIAEYNEAVSINEKLNGELDAKDQAISALRIEIHNIKEQQADFETRALVAEKNASKTESKLVAERLRASDAERELKRLKELNPDRLSKSNKEKTKLLDMQRRELTSLRTSLLDERRENNKQAGKVTELCKTLEEYAQVIEKYRARDKAKVIFDKHLKEAYPVTLRGEEMPAFVYLIPGGLQSFDDSLLNLDWKIFVMTATGEGTAVMIDRWLCPTAPKTEVTESWPSVLNTNITEFALEALEGSHPELVARHEWAKTVSVSDICPEKQAQLLLDNDLPTLKDVMFNVHRLKTMRGIGDKTASVIMDYTKQFIAKSGYDLEGVAKQEAA